MGSRQLMCVHGTTDAMVARAGLRIAHPGLHWLRSSLDLGGVLDAVPPQVVCYFHVWLRARPRGKADCQRRGGAIRRTWCAHCVSCSALSSLTLSSLWRFYTQQSKLETSASCFARLSLVAISATHALDCKGIVSVRGQADGLDIRHSYRLQTCRSSMPGGPWPSARCTTTTPA